MGKIKGPLFCFVLFCHEEKARVWLSALVMQFSGPVHSSTTQHPLLAYIFVISGT